VSKCLCGFHMRVLIADGGTGGHIFPAIAVADELRKRNDVEAILFTGTPLGLESEILPRHGYELRMIQIGGLIGKSLLKRLKTLMQLPFAYFQSREIIKDFRPGVVIGFGAYASGPVLVAAHHRKVPILLVEPNAVPGFTNRAALKFATRVAVTYQDHNGQYRGKAVLTGTPVRPLKTVPLNESKFTVGVVGGSQGSRALNQIVVEALTAMAQWKDRVHLIHQTGKSEYSKIQEQYEKLAPFFEVTPFIHDVEAFYNRCDLLICRAGAVTIAEITSLGKPAILVPLPTSTHDHQLQNAKRLSEAGAARMIEQQDLTPEILVKGVEDFLTDPQKLQRMAEASRQLGKPNAAKEVVDLALSLGKENLATQGLRNVR
jgi:UDP-N-acetylglucosamine--N-acetylmuramyl-(pentapeptide) pyrophosphoryl-undecaprenol N-acetylglucosamine transferase